MNKFFMKMLRITYIQSLVKQHLIKTASAWDSDSNHKQIAISMRWFLIESVSECTHGLLRTNTSKNANLSSTSLSMVSWILQ